MPEPNVQAQEAQQTGAAASSGDTLWSDRLRHLGLPLSFTKYRLCDTRLFRETGLLSLKEEEVLLYRVRDITLTLTWHQRIFGVGTICVISSDRTMPHLDIKNVKRPREIKELIFEHVEAAKEARRMRATEFFGDGEVEYETE